MQHLITYGQTFSKGQLTIPKKIRDYYGLGENFSYKITPAATHMIIEPQQGPVTKNLAAAINKLQEPLFGEQDYQDYLQSRKDWQDRLKKIGVK